MNKVVSVWSGKLLALHVQTPLHAGSGTALGTVDLPIQRERHTQWPTVAGSALKGILRDACREHLAAQADLKSRERFDDANDDDEGKKKERREQRVSNKTLADATLDLNLLFGPPATGASEFAGALSITDARLLAFPVRSARGVFAWVTCPAALDRLQRDALLSGQNGITWKVPVVGDRKCLCATQSPCLANGVALLEELDFARDPDQTVDDIASWISDNLIPSRFQGAKSRFPGHFLVIPDDDFTHFVRHATEVSARIALDYDSKTVKGGALFYQEFLPAESLLYSVVLANPARSSRSSLAANELLDNLVKWVARDDLRILQVGGDESTGKGLCAIRFS